MILYPAIDLYEGRVVRLRQGDYDRLTAYGDDPVAQARLFAEAGCTWLHVVDLEGARAGEPRHLHLLRPWPRRDFPSSTEGGSAAGRPSRRPSGPARRGSWQEAFSSGT